MGQIRTSSPSLVNQSTAPSNKSIPWQDSDTGIIYNYDATLNKWLGEAFIMHMSRSGNSFPAALKMPGNVIMDSTDANYIGYLYPFDVLLNRVYMTASPVPATPNPDAKFLLMGATQDTAFSMAYPNALTVDSTGIGITLSSGTYYSGYLTDDGDVPSDPVIYLFVQPVEDP
jgi:hypothetical protein